jgi:hypothetical protein
MASLGKLIALAAGEVPSMAHGPTATLLQPSPSAAMNNAGNSAFADPIFPSHSCNRVGKTGTNLTDFGFRQTRPWVLAANCRSTMLVPIRSVLLVRSPRKIGRAVVGLCSVEVASHHAGLSRSMKSTTHKRSAFKRLVLSVVSDKNHLPVSLPIKISNQHTRHGSAHANNLSVLAGKVSGEAFDGFHLHAQS